jgi:hypothetical protein
VNGTVRKKNTIILAAGEQRISPIRGKLPIDWVIENVAGGTGQHAVFVVLNKDNHALHTSLESRYPEITLVPVDEAEQVAGYSYPYSILHSLSCGLEALPENADVVEIVLGDTVCECGKAEGVEDCVLVSGDFLSSERWCLVECDSESNLQTIYDKVPGLNLDSKAALVGVYRFGDLACLRQALAENLRNKRSNMSDVLIAYNRTHPLKCIEVDVWFDLGHQAGIIKAQNHFFNSREFNRLHVDPVRGVIKKISTDGRKLHDEFEWYCNLPDDLKILTPRVISFEQGIDHAVLAMEMFGYSPLSEFFVLGDLRIEEWELVLIRLFEIHKLLEEYSGDLDTNSLRELYIEKTRKRLWDLKKQNSYWERIWNYDTIILNEKECRNIAYFEETLEAAADALTGNARITIMHGDFCFSNILFERNTFTCRLIDPRGRIGGRTIYGDPRYDVAKLRHSVVGGYDFAAHNYFRITEHDNRFTVRNYRHPDQDRLDDLFDSLTVRFGYNIYEIKLIEILLFLSMISLHKDSFERQKLLYLTAVQKINELMA